MKVDLWYTYPSWVAEELMCMNTYLLVYQRFGKFLIIFEVGVGHFYQHQRSPDSHDETFAQLALVLTTIGQGSAARSCRAQGWVACLAVQEAASYFVLLYLIDQYLCQVLVGRVFKREKHSTSRD